ncbi:glutathione S-transferase [Corallococcus sp. ZKHCc1 1396]|uniref:Glutathione S-transferase n=1 Tax=Corallococcus soli TaxID=2710757 RepID=A0ABR9PJD4_9BACT|nr:glutathione S-transferase [Corallococcus soli]MBE4748016.1 glutathione S-transferase [Corallococcus soli]RYZ38960.1 MAG: glutathione S-transferase [Myxococcaceae bacterium]
MLKVHHLNESRSQRILWLLEELGLDYEIVRYQRDPKTRLAPPELKAVHPLGKSPVVEDDGRVLAESGAIIETLIRRHGKGRLAPAPEDQDAYTHWLHFAEGSAMLPVMQLLYVKRLGEAGAPLMPRIDSELKNHLGYMEGALQGREYLVGQALSGADIQNSFVLESARAFRLLGEYPNLTAYLDRLHARPAYQRAVEKGGPYALGR